MDSGPARFSLIGALITGAVLVSSVAGLVKEPRSVRAAALWDDPPQKKALPPLEIDKDEPLLLDSAAKPAPDRGKKSEADNGPCFVCHANYKKEPLAVKHAAHNVGCMNCHGASEAHRNDENNITPPEIMYPLATLDAACRECHQHHDVTARHVVAQFVKKNPGRTDVSQLVCTDCHGEHRLAHRTVHWDRATGKLLSSEVKKEK